MNYGLFGFVYILLFPLQKVVRERLYKEVSVQRLGSVCETLVHAMQQHSDRLYV